MRTTKDMSLALERAAELLPKGSVEPAGHGQRTLSFTRPNGGRWVETGTIFRCLYLALFTLSLTPELGGIGKSWEEIRDGVRLRPEAVPDPDTHGVGAHERQILAAAALRRE